jgi:hypothetical protein
VTVAMTVAMTVVTIVMTVLLCACNVVSEAHGLHDVRLPAEYM